MSLDRLPYVQAFAIGAATMGFELVAARVVAMNVGVALYAWSGVLGAVLAGLAIGYFIAARSANLPDSRSIAATIHRSVIAAAVTGAVIVIVLTADSMVQGLDAIPRIPRLLIVVGLTGFVPAVFLGMAAPSLARSVTTTLGSAGARLGALGAMTSLGGLVGSGATGLFLIPTIGTRGAALTWAGALVLAVVRLGDWRVAGLLLCGGVALTLMVPHACLVESAYQCLRVDEETMIDGLRVRVLYLDGLPHAHVTIDDPLRLAHDYLVPAVEVAAYLRPIGGAPPAVLIIGGGGYSLASYFAAAYPGAVIDVIEIDPAVTAVARGSLGLRPDILTTIHHGDARSAVDDLPIGRRYDLAVLDAFADVVVPFQLVTAEFDTKVRSRLGPDGAYVALVHDRADRGRLMPAVLRTMSGVFGAVDVLAAGPGVQWSSPFSRTWSVVGSAAPIDPARLRATLRVTANGGFPAISEIAPQSMRERWLIAPGPAILTDDYAPVEQLGAVLFE